MTWPIPAPGDIAERYAAGFEAAFALDPATGLPRVDTIDARSDNTALRAIGVAGEETWTEAYLYQASLAAELMPDTAQDWLSRHGAEWGVPQLQPLTALGNLIFAGPAGTPLPQGIEVYDQTGLRWQTSAAATMPGSGAISVPSEALTAGTAANAAAGTVLRLVWPVAGLAPQSAVVDPAGFNGGRDLEDVEAWRGRILQRIRKRGQAGAVADYQGWAVEGGASFVQVLPRWIGAGTVGIAVLMAGPRVPSPAELARVDAVIQDDRPVTATAITLAASLAPVDVTLALSPDSLGTRAAATAALQSFFAREAGIGRTLPRSRLDEAVSSASGEYAHVIAAPAADVVPAATAMPTLGVVGFTTGAALPQNPF